MTVFFPFIPFRHVGIGAFYAERRTDYKKWARSINCNDYGTQEHQPSVLSLIGVFSKPHIPHEIIDYTQKHIRNHYYHSNKHLPKESVLPISYKKTNKYCVGSCIIREDENEIWIYKTKSRHYFNHVGTGRQFDKMANRGWLKKTPSLTDRCWTVCHW